MKSAEPYFVLIFGLAVSTMFFTLSHIFFSVWHFGPTRVMVSPFFRFIYHTIWHTTFGRAPLGEWSAFWWNLYLTTHNIRNRHPSMPSVGFELNLSKRTALDRAATWTGHYLTHNTIFEEKLSNIKRMFGFPVRLSKTFLIWRRIQWDITNWYRPLCKVLFILVRF
jgi:hypothetical protein